VVLGFIVLAAACSGDRAQPGQGEGPATVRSCTEVGGREVTVILNKDALIAVRDANLKVGPDEPLIPLPMVITAAVIRCELPEPVAPIAGAAVPA
jgi:hypothetical protein